MIEKFYFNIIMLIFGGALGATARFTISQFIDKHFTTQFPVGIFIVNIIGCFFIGLIMSLLQNKFLLNEVFRFFLVIGFLGSLTTFSTFAFSNLISHKSFSSNSTTIFFTHSIGRQMIESGGVTLCEVLVKLVRSITINVSNSFLIFFIYRSQFFPII